MIFVLSYCLSVSVRISFLQPQCGFPTCIHASNTNVCIAAIHCVCVLTPVMVQLAWYKLLTDSGETVLGLERLLCSHWIPLHRYDGWNGKAKRELEISGNKEKLYLCVAAVLKADYVFRKCPSCCLFSLMSSDQYGLKLWLSETEETAERLESAFGVRLGSNTSCWLLNMSKALGVEPQLAF